MNQSWLTLLVLVQGNYSYFCGSHLWGNSVMFSAFAHFHGLYSPRNSLGVGSLSLLQGIFPTQELNPDLPHCRRIIYQLSHKGSPRILEWVAYPFFSRSFWPRKQTQGLLHYRQILYQLSYQGGLLASYPCPSEGRQNENHNHRKLIKLMTWTTALSNSMKLWAMPHRATQDRQVTVESSEKMWPSEKGVASHVSILALRTPWTVWKDKKDRTLKDELPRSVGAQ